MGFPAKKTDAQAKKKTANNPRNSVAMLMSRLRSIPVMKVTSIGHGDSVGIWICLPPKLLKTLRIDGNPKKGIFSINLFWGWDWDHQSYCRKGSGFLGKKHFLNFKDPKVPRWRSYSDFWLGFAWPWSCGKRYFLEKVSKTYFPKWFQFFLFPNGGAKCWWIPWDRIPTKKSPNQQINLVLV